MAKRHIDRARIAKDVRAGATDTSIMDRYELSKEELYSYYDELVKEGRLAMSDLLGDLPPEPAPGLMLVEECPVCGTHNLVDTERCASCGSTLPRPKTRSSVGEFPSKASEPIKISVHVPGESPKDEVTDWDRGSPGTSGEQVVLVEEDATVNLDTVLDDFAGVGSGVHGFADTDDSAWAVTTSGQDILEAIESIPRPSEADSLDQEVEADEVTDSIIVQTELSLDEILTLASEAGGTGVIDGKVPDGPGEAQQLDFDFDFDQTIALVHRENLLRKKKEATQTGESGPLEPETTVEGLITLSSEIEVPEGQELDAPPAEEDSSVVFQTGEVVPPEESAHDLDQEMGDSLEPSEESPDADEDVEFVPLSHGGGVPLTGSDDGSTQGNAPYFEPTVRLDLTGGFDLDADDSGITPEDELPGDDVDLDFTTIADLESTSSGQLPVGSEEEPPQDFEATAPLETEFTFNLDDLDDEKPESADEEVALSFDGEAEEQGTLSSADGIPQVPVLQAVRDTQLLETQPLSQFEEYLHTSPEAPAELKPPEKSGTLRLIAAASILFTIVGLGGLGTYTGFVTIPDSILSHLPLMDKEEKPKPSVDRGRKKPPQNQPAPTVKQESAQKEHAAANSVQSPTVKVSPGIGEQVAARPTQKATGGAKGIRPGESDKRSSTSPDGKRRSSRSTLPAAAAPELDEAVRDNDVEKVALLLNRGSDLNGKDADGATPLIVAVVQGNESLVELLLKHGANPNVKDRKGDTPLMLAAGKGHVPVVKILLKGGADPGQVNNEGRTVLAQVYASGPTLLAPVQACREIVRLIREYEERQAFAKGR